MAEQRVTVTVEDGFLGRIDEVVAGLEAAGVRVDEVLRPVGVITGRVPEPGPGATVAALARVSGVAGVEPAGGVQLPPPDAPLQ